MDAVTSVGDGRYQGGISEGAMSYKFVVTKHIDACADVSMKLFTEDVSPARWVHGWGIMVAVLERLAKPYLEDDEGAKVDHKKRQGQTDKAQVMTYLIELLDRYEHIVTRLHAAGVIHPRDIPTEDARGWFLTHIGLGKNTDLPST